MKFKITMKDPDGVYDCVKDAVKESLSAIEGLSESERESLYDARRDSFNSTIGKWFEYGEYLTVEVDTEAKTIRVCEKE